MANYPIACFDFDGVINSYKSGFQKGPITDPPVEGIEEVLKGLYESGWKVVVFTTRALTDEGAGQVWNYLKQNGLVRYIYDVTAIKPPARVYVDDRAINFDGNTTSLLRDILTFKTYME